MMSALRQNAASLAVFVWQTVTVAAQKHHRGRLADELASADHDGVPARAVNAVIIEQLHARGGRARRKTESVPSRKNVGFRQGGHAVHVFSGVEAGGDLVLVRLEVLRHGAEQQHAVDGSVGVQHVDRAQNRLFFDRFRKEDASDRCADGIRAPANTGFIAQIGGVFANANQRERRRDALRFQCGGAVGKTGSQRVRRFFAE